MSNHPQISIRPYQPDEAATLLDLFRRTVRQINAADYNARQISAWASEDIPLQDWQDRFARNFAVVAEIGKHVAGFADLTVSGYLDRLYVSADFQRRGVATALLSAIKEHAAEQNLSELTTEASITARPFFESAGFHVVKEQTVHCRGEDFTNFQMKMELR